MCPIDMLGDQNDKEVLEVSFMMCAPRTCSVDL
jgi:hypothetical protein